MGWNKGTRIAEWRLLVPFLIQPEGGMKMKKRIVLGFSAAIVVVLLLLAGSSLGAYVRAQVEEQEAGAIGCGDSVSCSRTSWVMRVINTGTGHGIYGRTNSSTGTKAAVYGNATDKARGLWGKSNKGFGVAGQSTNNHGVYGRTNSSSENKAAVYGVSTGNARGVYGKHVSSGNYGYLGGEFYAVYGRSRNYNGVLGSSDGSTGVYGVSTDATGVYAKSHNGNAIIAVSTHGYLIEAWDNSPMECRFRVTNWGDVYCDGEFYNVGCDFAEMLPAADGLEPADVLVVGPDGKLARSSAAYSTAVVGVYSTDPGFIGGKGIDEDTTGKVPLGVVGVVPVKASAENGTICPGDLLTTSGTPGHAMKATDVKTGTIIGKALESLESGTGTIKMLVTLQ